MNFSSPVHSTFATRSESTFAHPHISSRLEERRRGELSDFCNNVAFPQSRYIEKPSATLSIIDTCLQDRELPRPKN
jgi:hypothetical protein